MITDNVLSAEYKSKQFFIDKLISLRNQYQWDKLNSLYQYNGDEFNNEDIIDHGINNESHSIEGINNDNDENSNSNININNEIDNEVMNENLNKLNTFDHNEFQNKHVNNNSCLDNEQYCIDCKPSYELINYICQCKHIKTSNEFNNIETNDCNTYNDNDNIYNDNNSIYHDNDDKEEELSIQIKSLKKSSRHIIYSDSDDDNNNTTIYNTLKSSKLKETLNSNDSDSIIFIESDDESKDNSIIDILFNEDDDDEIDDYDYHIYSDIEKENNIKNTNTIPTSTTHIVSNNIIDLTESPILFKKKPSNHIHDHQYNHTMTNKNNVLTISNKKNQKNISSTTKKKIFKSNCNDRILELYSFYNEMIFQNKLPIDLSITWNNRLLTTAGITIYKQHVDNGHIIRKASIELSTKVVDDDIRLQETLLHELCHVATYLIDHIRNPPHGRHFKHWGEQVHRYVPHILVTTCHSYAIHQPHRFQCTNTTCQVIYRRHTKKGINLQRSRCGLCKSELVYVGIANEDGVIKNPRKIKGFSLYVKENFNRIKQSQQQYTDNNNMLGSIKHGDIMRILADEYKLFKSIKNI